MKYIKKYSLYLLLIFIIEYIVSFIFNSTIHNEFKLDINFHYLFHVDTLIFSSILFISTLLVIAYEYQKYYFLKNGKKLVLADSELEKSRFMTEKEIKSLFDVTEFDELKNFTLKGNVIKTEYKNKKLLITTSKQAEHTLGIGSTGSGKSANLTIPSVEIISETKEKPSIVVTDPKGEILQKTGNRLIGNGYETLVIDLRNLFRSIRWNPLEIAYDLYQRAHNLKDEVVVNEEEGYSFFNDKKFYDINDLNAELQVVEQQLKDEAYDHLNDIFQILFPSSKDRDPVWDTGPKNFLLAISLAMLEDSLDPDLNLTKDKFNFYSMAQIVSRTDNECKDLIKYFQNRNKLSNCVTLAKQIFDASDRTRGSYLSMTFDKMAKFSDSGICALTSKNEIDFKQLDEKPTAVFIIIPDEKETRYDLASMIIVNAYKELVQKASKSEGLTLKRPVYFILDEFGNLPKIPKMEQMITVGRSRNIIFNLIIQSYSQLSQVYGEDAASIIKANCNIQMFIGTTDIQTIDEFSKRLGKYTVSQRSVGSSLSKTEDISTNISGTERPVMYASELQTLNSNGTTGNVIIQIFRYLPIKSKLIPYYKSKELLSEPYEVSEIKPRPFYKEDSFYDISIRNGKYETESQIDEDIKNTTAEIRRTQKIELDNTKTAIKRATNDILSDEEVIYLLQQIDRLEFESVVEGLEKAKQIAISQNRKPKLKFIEDAITRMHLIMDVKKRR